MITVDEARRQQNEELLSAALERRRRASEGGAYAQLMNPEPLARHGPLSRVPVAVKDIIDVEGMPTRAGSAAFRFASPAQSDAPIVARLRRAGAAIVGKTALHEIAFGTTGINGYEGTPHNPHDQMRICGGSSSGSAAAIAEGCAAVALGSDTGGSVRIPAALCGVVGFKPVFGRLSTSGMLLLAPSLDHVGILGADVRSVAETFSVLVEDRLVDPDLPRTLGIDRDSLESASPMVAAAIERALRSLRELEPKEVDTPDQEVVEAESTTILFFEAAREHRAHLEAHPSDYGADVRDRLVLGSRVSSTAYEAARRSVNRIQVEAFRAPFRRVT